MPTSVLRSSAGKAGTSAPGPAPSSLRRLTRLELRDLQPLDWPEGARIYEEQWDAAHSAIRLVAELDGKTAGWAALTPSSDRGCYRGVAENSVYVASWAQGQGVGRGLLEALIARSEAEGIWTLEAGIFPENKASVRLHLGCGFRLVGVRERLGELNGEWRDVLLLERRSGVVA